MFAYVLLMKYISYNIKKKKRKELKLIFFSSFWNENRSKRKKQIFVYKKIEHQSYIIQKSTK